MTFQMVKDFEEELPEAGTGRCRHKDEVGLMTFQMVKDREDEMREAENDQRMETVQDRFPYDDLNLGAKDKTPVGHLSYRSSLYHRVAETGEIAVVFLSVSASKRLSLQHSFDVYACA